MNLNDHLYNFRRGIGDMGYGEALGVGYLNAAVRDLSKNVKVLKQFSGKRSWSSINHIANYAMPSLHTHLRMVVRYDNDPVIEWPKINQELLQSGDRFSEGDPVRYAVYNGNLELYPIPEADADTVNLNGAVTKTATTFTVDSVSGLESAGRGIVDNEVFSWGYIDSTNLQLKGITRGLEGTIAAAHSDGSTITERNIEWFGGLLPKRFFARPSRSAQLAVSANASGVDDGEHYVYITFYSQKWHSESLRTEVDSITATSQQIDISDIPSSDEADISHVRIYMTAAGGTTAYYVDEVAIGTTSYSITVDDSTLIGNDVYSHFESDLPFNYRDIIDDLALAQWFFDNEQYRRWEARKANAERKILDWLFAMEIEMGGEIINE